MLSLPALEFKLPEWPEHAFLPIRSREQQVRAIAKGAGSNSDSFKQACKKLKLAFERADKHELSTILKEKVDVRAFTFLLSGDKGFSDNLLIDKPLLEQLLNVTNPLSKLSLMQLIRAYFIHFDKIASGDDLEYWSFFINKQLINLDLKFGNNELKTYADNHKWIFGRSGPMNMAKRAQADKVDLDLYIKRLSLDGYGASRYMTLARYQYYLQQLEALTVGEDSPVLAEMVKADVFNSPYENNRLLGHAMLEMMIDKSAGQALSDSWQRVILSIAGDPRVPKSHPKYQKWWAILGEKRIALVRGWLSSFDLSLFLRVLEQSAKDGSNQDMERMFQPRKLFIDGLDKTGLIRDSRLFLSRYAETYLHKHYKKEELPSYARVTSQNTSMIYLNIDDKVHMIEGSHSFTLKLMDRLPSRCRVNDYSLNVITNDELRTTVGHQYRNEFVDEDGILEAQHDQHLNWQHKALLFLSKRVKISASDVLGKDRLRQFKQKFGA